MVEVTDSGFDSDSKLDDRKLVGERIVSRLRTMQDVVQGVLIQLTTERDQLSKAETAQVLSLTQVLNVLTEFYSRNWWFEGSGDIEIVELIPEESLKETLELLVEMTKQRELPELTSSADMLRELARDQCRSALQHVVELDEVAQTEVRDGILGLRDRIEVISSLRDIQQAAAEAQQTARHVKEVAGAEAQGALAEHFSRFADRQRKAANYMRAFVIALVLLVTALTAWLVSFQGATASWLELAKKLALTLPLAGLAAYLARESSHYRSAADWADAITVQLRTVNAYTDPLPLNVRDQIRSSFGQRLFAHGPPGNSKKGKESPVLVSGVSPESLVDLAKALAEAAAKSDSK